jgi:hypothetical protein
MAYSSIVKPTDYFNTLLYSGTGSSNAITGLDFQPDWVSIKKRSAAGSGNVYDSVRGALKHISTNLTAAEETESSGAGLTTFGSNGFTVGTEPTGNGSVNQSSQTYVAWNWKANGSGSSNSDGSITSTVSANTTAGFSIVSYSGVTGGGSVGHGLGVKPDIVLIKCRSATANWLFTTDIIDGSKDYLFLNQTNAKGNLTTALPTSSVFTVSGDDDQGENGKTYIAYCFNSVKGYSKFGNYTGNGSTDGTFIYTGFKPAFVIIKVSNKSGYTWVMYDNKRNTFNIVGQLLQPDVSDAELDNSNIIDFLSNGIKMRNNSLGTNGSADTYIYMAFAENPFVANDSGTAVPVVAR